jgi:hypothetical protein
MIANKKACEWNMGEERKSDEGEEPAGDMKTFVFQFQEACH